MIPMTPDRSSDAARSGSTDEGGTGERQAVLASSTSVLEKGPAWTGTVKGSRSASDGQASTNRDRGGVGGGGGASAAASKSSKGPSSGRPSSRASSVLPYHPNLSPRTSAGRFSSAQAAHAFGNSPAGSASRFLLTVVPPNHLPHDPPHPRTSQACSGYGPPHNFRRGTLVPLYPTLSSQLGAIAREYGLPSTGGLVLYLLSTSDPNSATRAALPESAGFAGEDGPRIGEEAWRLLWGRLFELEDEAALVRSGGEYSDEEDYEEIAPPVPPIPLPHRYMQQQQRRLPSDGEHALSSDGDQELDLDAFSSDAASADAEGPSAFDPSTIRARTVRQPASPNSIGRGPPPSLPSPSSRTGTSHPLSRGLPSSSSQPNLRHASLQSTFSTSRSSRSTTTRQTRPSSAASSYVSHPLGPAPFGATVVVGKVEFDIDQRRGAGRTRWYDNWVEAAETASTVNSSAGPSPHLGYSSTSSATETSIDERDELPRSVAAGSELMVASTSASSSQPGLRELWSIPSPARKKAFFPSAPTSAALSAPDDFSEAAFRASSPSPNPRSPSTSLTSLKINGQPQHSEQEESLLHGYAPLADEDDGELEPSEPIVAVAPHDDADPLGDVFPSDEETWKYMAEEARGSKGFRPVEPAETTGLGIMGARIEKMAATAPPGVVENFGAAMHPGTDGVLPPQDDVAEVMEMLKSGGHQQPHALDLNLASPIHLETSPTAPQVSGIFVSEEPSSTRSAHASLSESLHGTPRPSFISSLPPSPPTSISDRSAQPHRKGGIDWVSPVPVLDSANSSTSSEVELDDAARASTIGLMENLDDLERALGELSPRTRNIVASPPLQEVARVEDQPDPALALSRFDSAQASAGHSDDVEHILPRSPPTSRSPPTTRSPSATTSPVLGTRPVHIYPTSTALSSPPTVFSSLTSPPSPPVNLPPAPSPEPTIRAATPTEPLTPSAPNTPRARRPSAGEDTLPRRSTSNAPPTPRTPRTSSLSRRKIDLTLGPAATVPLPPSPMPSFDDYGSTSRPSVNSFSVSPSSPVVLQQLASSPPLPPLPNKTKSLLHDPTQFDISLFEPRDVTPPVPVPSAVASTSLNGSTGSTGSPRGLNLRSGKSKSPVLDDGDGEAPKSPLNAFFQKPAFKFFSSKRTDPSSPVIDAFPVPPSTYNVAPTSPLSSSLSPATDSSATSPGFQSSVNSRDAAFTSYSPDPTFTSPSTPVLLPPDSLRSENESPLISSPRSDYTPSSPHLGVSATRYPASAPSTPATWAARKDFDSSRFGRTRPKHRLSADIENLLSQMNEINFGDEDSVDGGKTVSMLSDASSAFPAHRMAPLMNSTGAGPGAGESHFWEELTHSKAYNDEDLTSLGNAMATMSATPPTSPLLNTNPNPRTRH